jgi:HlyD family secretion protein
MKKYGKIIIVISILLVLIIAFLWFRNQGQTSTQSTYQTVEAQQGSLMATIGATGTVRSNQSAILTWQTSGTIGETQVVLGENVIKGSTLASLLPDSLPQNVILAQADLVNAKRVLESALNSTTAQAQAQLTLANAQRIYDDAKWTRQNLETGRNNIDAAANAEAQYIIASKSLENAQAAYDRLESLADDNPIKAQAYSTLYAAQQAVKSRLNAWNWYKNLANSQDISEADAKLALAEAQLQDAQREWNRLKDGPDPDDIASAQARVTAAQANLKFASILAPFSGTVTEVKSMFGDQVSPGVPGFRIDDLSRLLVDVQVSEVDINGVKMDQPVSLTFDAILDVIYEGKVVSVAQVGNTTQGGVTFSVTVELTDFDKRVKPGMTSAVTIVVNQLDNVLLVPNRAVRLVNNQRVVYILVNGEAKEVKINLGATSGIDSEVLSGDLKKGDLIILNPSLNIGPGSGNGGGMGGMFGG